MRVNCVYILSESASRPINEDFASHNLEPASYAPSVVKEKGKDMAYLARCRQIAAELGKNVNDIPEPMSCPK